MPFLEGARDVLAIQRLLLRARDSALSRFVAASVRPSSVSLHQSLAGEARDVLSDGWRDVSRKQGPAPATVREVFRIHVQHAESSVAAAMAAAKGPMAELVEADGPANGPLGGAPSMPVLTAKTMAGVWEEAAAAVIAALGVLRRKHCPPRRQAGAPMLRARVAAKAAMRCTSACKLLFVARGREHTSKRVLAAVLRQGRALVAELQAWLPLLAQMFRASPTTTGRFLTHGQQCVRQLHTVMQHGKEVRDQALMKAVPRLKQACETFVLGIRSELERAGALRGYSIANLKHRTVEGVEVGSQIVEPEEDEDGDSDLDDLHGAFAAVDDGATDGMTEAPSEAGIDLAGEVQGLLDDLAGGGEDDEDSETRHDGNGDDGDDDGGDEVEADGHGPFDDEDDEDDDE